MVTATVKVFNTRTKETQIWIANSGVEPMPIEWVNKLRPNERFIQGKAKRRFFSKVAPRTPHALENIVNELGSDWVIIEGGTSHNICKQICEPLLKRLGLELGGEKYPGNPDDTEYQTFWRP